MGKCLPICLIGMGGFILLMTGIMMVGFEFIVKTSIPIAMKLLPFNNTLNLFVDIPLTAHIKATLNSASATKEIENRTLGLGEINFNVEMGSWDQDNEVTFPIVFVQEEAALDQVMRYLLVLTDGPVNYIKTYVGLFGGVLILVGLIAGLMRLTTK